MKKRVIPGIATAITVVAAAILVLKWRTQVT